MAGKHAVARQAAPYSGLKSFKMMRSDCTDQCDCPGYVAIVGKPNAGKSTLLNAIMQQKLSIVTSKAQTTRHRIIAAHSEENFQCIFLDTPGVLRPVSRPVSPSANAHLTHSRCVMLTMAWCPAESFYLKFAKALYLNHDYSKEKFQYLAYSACVMARSFLICAQF